jgi:cell division cycle protein 20 (cofactor of APC complex)
MIDCSPVDMSISDTDSENSYNSKCSECAYKALIQENYNMFCMPNNRVLHFAQSSGIANNSPQPNGHNSAMIQTSSDQLCNSIQVAYEKAKKTLDEKKKSRRRIPRKSERILDAPELLDDYYLNLIDWSSSNRVAVCLGHSLYIWDAQTGASQQLLTHDPEHPWNVLTAVAWSPYGDSIAVGGTDRTIKIWDIASMTCKGELPQDSHESRISALAWNNRNGNILASGSRDSYILEHDLREWQRPVCRLHGHTQEVCGLKWSPEGMQLASGGNDNCLNVWELGSSIPHFSKPNGHNAAVKAIAWCPWKSHTLSTGGGTADKCIKTWNSISGECLNSVQTESQICSILFNSQEKELISSHGFSTNQISLWKFPSMEIVAELTGHKSRVLYMAMSPDCSTIVSGSADETLRFWKINSPTKQSPKKRGSQISKFNASELR